MDLDFWGSTVHTSNKQFSARLSSEANDDTRTYFACPFCYLDIGLSLFCTHLQQEHCFNVKNMVCPLCALNLGEDVIGHFEVHHASSIKTRRRSGFWSFYMGRSSLGGLRAKHCTENAHGVAAPDPLLSPFLISIPYSTTKGDQPNNSYSSNDVSTAPEGESSELSMSSQREETQDSEALRQRAVFCQQLVSSTIF